MNTNATNQTAKDIAQVVEIIAQRLHELAGACPREVETLGTLKIAAQDALENLRGAA